MKENRDYITVRSVQSTDRRETLGRPTYPVEAREGGVAVAHDVRVVARFGVDRVADRRKDLVGGGVQAGGHQVKGLILRGELSLRIALVGVGR